MFEVLDIVLGNDYSTFEIFILFPILTLNKTKFLHFQPNLLQLKMIKAINAARLFPRKWYEKLKNNFGTKIGVGVANFCWNIEMTSF